VFNDKKFFVDLWWDMNIKGLNKLFHTVHWENKFKKPQTFINYKYFLK
jgi:hypothetical protein